MGLAWLKEFWSACSDCHVDFVPIHWYDSATNVQYFKNYIQDARDAANGKPLWITEFGAFGDDKQIAAFMGEVRFFFFSWSISSFRSWTLLGLGTWPLMDSLL